VLNARIATPYYDMPITLVQKATNHKVFRQVHCLECGMPFAEITDKIITILDFDTPIDMLIPNVLGVVACHCPRKACQQRYRFEFAL
jgi:hypothetical protein